uniref:Uncharacterized protein n=1 Tax=Arundo donax TaxID=35708 RepID=A0A0A9EE89_ARUDO
MRIQFIRHRNWNEYWSNQLI